MRLERLILQLRPVRSFERIVTARFIGTLASVPPSIRLCFGCGIPLQTSEPDTIGYVPASIQEKYPNGKRTQSRLKYSFLKSSNQNAKVLNEENLNLPAFSKPTHGALRKNTRQLICQRCYQIQHYGKCESFPVNFSSNQDSHSILQKLILTMLPNSTVLYVIDLLNIETSHIPELFEACRNKNLQCIWIFNKMDCLPKGVNEIKLKIWIRNFVRQCKSSPYEDLLLVSSLKGHGFGMVESRLQVYEQKGFGKHIYIVGGQNSGKSTFRNRLFQTIGFKQLGSLDIKRGVGGTTQSIIPGTTLENVAVTLPNQICMVDTPGIPLPKQVTNSLSSIYDLRKYQIRRKISPLRIKIKTGNLISIGNGLVTLQMLLGANCCLILFVSHLIPVHYYANKNEFENHIPVATLDNMDTHRVQLDTTQHDCVDEISVPGLGWISLLGDGSKTFEIRTPKSVNLFRRPSILNSLSSPCSSLKFRSIKASHN